MKNMKKIWMISGCCMGLAFGLAGNAEALTLEGTKVLSVLRGLDGNGDAAGSLSPAVFLDEADGEHLLLANIRAVDDDVESYYLVTSDSSLYEVEYGYDIEDWGLAAFQLDTENVGSDGDEKILELARAHMQERATLYYFDTDFEERQGDILITGYQEEEGLYFLEYDILDDLSDEFLAPAAVINDDGSCIGVMVPGKDLGSDIMAFGEPGVDGSSGSSGNSHTWTNGSGIVYSGEIVDSEEGILESGYCTVEYANGATYEGGVDTDGRMDVWGIYCGTDGSKYEGEFDAGSRTGFGTYTSASGTTYEGEFQDAAFSGYGVFTSDGAKQVGQFALDPDAYGPDGRLWKAWVPEDQSNTQIWIYQVNEDSQKDGLSFRLASDGSYECSWYENGECVDEDLETREAYNGILFTGRFTDSEENNGMLVCQYPEDEDGCDFYVGSFENGVRNGIGVYLWDDGSFHVGEYEDGDFEGDGVIYDPNDGYWYNGSWKADKKEGVGWRYTEDNGLERMVYENGEVQKQEAF